MSLGTVLVTGASSGIGRASALLLAQRGFDVAVHYRTQQDSAARVAQEIQRAGRQAVTLQADLSQPLEVERLYRELDATLGGLSGVVNSAGIGLRRSPVVELEAAALAHLLHTNVLGLVISCREAVKRLARSRGGRGGTIVNVSSMAATIGGRPGSAAYAASKAAVDAFTIGLAKEVASEGIRAVSLRPGMVDTEMTRDNLRDPGFVATIKASIPLGRPAHVDEVAAPIAWLLSEEAAFITGACIDVSGGGFHIAR